LDTVYKVLTIALGLWLSRWIGAASGAVLNPSIYLGLNLTEIFDSGIKGGAFKGFYIYIIGPLIGGAIAGFWNKKS